MSKAEEYTRLSREMHEALAVSMDSVDAVFARVNALNAFKDWEEANRDLIAYALRLEHAVRTGDNDDFPLLDSLGDACVHAVRDNLVSNAARGLRVLAALRKAMKLATRVGACIHLRSARSACRR